MSAGSGQPPATSLDEPSVPSQSPDEPSVLYEDTQRARLATAGLVMGLTTQTAALIREVRAHRRRAWLQALMVAFSAAALYAFSSLTVTVRRGELTAAFAAGLLRRSVDLHSIASARVVTLPWYYGWGARFTPHGLLYSVVGRDAVRLELAGGGGFTIGSPEPHLLLNAIEQARRLPPA
jgi:hypothetical protein